MKNKFSIFMVFVLVLTLTACSNSKSSMAGSWVRNGDSQFKGMEVTLEKLDSGDYRAKVTKADDKGIFAQGNVKWRDVKKVKENEYDLYDLGDAGQWYEMTLTYNTDDDTLSLQSFDNQGEEGASQIWNRVE
ncbi:hypothetical protein P40081_28400 [Paenibacillus sp. FSL P4-0081]|uniref:hypothetical protein n=1 Tax=Paenibacillus sp. FSL P4-0081 TaxID=1536769 RepID=UPI0004F7EBFC|nr:hypothetical protein [Paenibacillus sp. FSL P4-0081]AIQ31623.1 hypothetical protein P40081_28400 [Paenibacillus sp. FSL P4-0081]